MNSRNMTSLFSEKVDKGLKGNYSYIQKTIVVFFGLFAKLLKETIRIVIFSVSLKSEKMDEVYMKSNTHL